MGAKTGLYAVQFQFTPPRGGKQGKVLATPSDNIISIHAPARGQTGRIIAPGRSRSISIHAPARGQTWPATSSTHRNYFNSRPREGANFYTDDNCTIEFLFQFTPPRGGKPVAKEAGWDVTEISIHAPARGQTGTVPACQGRRTDFNSRPREGANRKTSQYLATIHSFNSNNSRKSAVKLHIMSRSRADNAV